MNFKRQKKYNNIPDREGSVSNPIGLKVESAVEPSRATAHRTSLHRQTGKELTNLN